MIRSTGRLAVTLGLIAVCVVWIAQGVQLIPSIDQEVIDGRLRLCEVIALNTTSFAEQGNLKGLERMLSQVAQRNPQIYSIGVRKNERLILDCGDHPTHWRGGLTSKQGGTNKSTPTHLTIDVFANGRPWGMVEIRFAPLPYAGIWGFARYPLMLIIFCGALVSLFSWAFLSRSLKYLNPSKVVPSRVRMALDSLAEGLILLDPSQQIVLANDSFSKIVNIDPDDLLGEDPNQFAWKVESQNGDTGNLPWQSCLQSTQPRLGQLVTLPGHDGNQRKFIVNASPIVGADGQCKGALASFDDVTALEDKRIELTRLLKILRASRDEIRRQNDHLQYLATRDSLTGCLNRRSFFDRCTKLWDSRDIEQLNIIMLDIDHFKSINDHFGHATGDEVIKTVAEISQECVGDQGFVCRYGGEEFCVAVPNVSIDEAFDLAERIRLQVEDKEISNASATLSIGVSARQFGAMDLQHLVDQADQCLYAAKNRGRNQAIRWDQCARDDMLGESEHEDSDAGSLSQIERASVEALYAALYYRDATTALHSARVANLAQALAKRMLDKRTVKIVEVAGLLHDVGKLGIPDSILHNPNALNQKQLEIMKQRHTVSQTIAKSAVGSPDVAQILRHYQVHFDQGAGYVDLEKSQPRIALACRILAVCDAFDSMIHHAQYRNAKSHHAAISELWQCAPHQFDPQIVALLEIVVEEEPSALQPLQIEGVWIDVEHELGSVDAKASAQIGDVAPLRAILKRIKKHDDLDGNPEIQDAVKQLESSLKQNDEELKKLIDMTQDLVGLCRKNGRSETLHDISTLLDEQ